jgi:hypothetical protein
MDDLEYALNDAGLEVTRTMMEGLSQVEQAEIVNNTSIVIAAHGAAWTWIMLASRPEALLLEIMHVIDPDCEYLRSPNAHPWRGWAAGSRYYTLDSVVESLEIFENKSTWSSSLTSIGIRRLKRVN